MGRNSFLLWIVQGPKIFPFDSLLSLSSRWSNCSCCRSAPWPPQELAGEHRSQEQINNSHGFHPKKKEDPTSTNLQVDTPNLQKLLAPSALVAWMVRRPATAPQQVGSGNLKAPKATRWWTARWRWQGAEAGRRRRKVSVVEDSDTEISAFLQEKKTYLLSDGPDFMTQ